VLPQPVAWRVLSAEAMTKGELREEIGMRKKFFVLMTLLWGSAGQAHLAAQGLASVKQPEVDRQSSSAAAIANKADFETQTALTAGEKAVVGASPSCFISSGKRIFTDGSEFTR
jgi:hypothetical protein